MPYQPTPERSEIWPPPDVPVFFGLMARTLGFLVAMTLNMFFHLSASISAYVKWNK
jgi:hypothetical protein